MRLPTKTQDKLNRLFEILKMLPEDFISNEVRKTMKANGIGDYQRYILMLYQGGFLSRAGDMKKFTYTKTDLALLPEEQLANAIMDQRNEMFGYNQANPELKMLEKAKKVESEARMKDIAQAVARVGDIEPEEEEQPAPHQSNGHPTPATVPSRPAPRTIPLDDAIGLREAAPPTVELDPRSVFASMHHDYEAIRKVLPKLSVRDFLIMWLRGTDKA